MITTMPHIPSNLRLLLLLSPLKPSPSFSFFSKPNSRPYTVFHTTICSSSSSRRHRNIPYRDFPLHNGRRNNSNLNEGNSRDKNALMGETDTSSTGFNKRRAEGNDNSDKPKRNPQLKKARKLNPTNTIAYVQILGTGMDTQDTSPSVLLFFDKQRFIFNAGEGLQRFCTEHKIKLSKIDHIFLSRVCSETAGGLPGLLLTLAGIGEEGMSVNIWGPSDLKYLVDAMRSFIPRASMVHTHSFGPAPCSTNTVLFDPSKSGDHIVLVDDEVVKISAILLQPNHSKGSAVKSGEMSVIYVCELPEIVGKFDPKKAVALGLKPGKKYSELQSGNSVKSDLQDIMVHPSDVMGPSVPGPVVLLVDCPTEFHAHELLSTKSFSSYYVDALGDPTESTKTASCIIHLSPSQVIHSGDYQNWMKRFGPAQHIIAGHEMKNVEIPILKASARIAARLNYLCPQFFPAPGFWSLGHSNGLPVDSPSARKVSISNLCESISAENLLKFTLRPHAHLGLDRSSVPSLSTSSNIINELHSEIPEIVEAAQHVKNLWGAKDPEDLTEEPWLDENKLPSCLENIRRDDLEIVLLGTGSSQPSKYRNVTSIYVNLFSNGSLLLDCGEGTLGQLKRRYGVQGADNAVKNLRCIWISHIHADHHTGLARILALRRDLLNDVPHEPLLVVGPRQLKRYLEAYQKLENLDMLFLDCRSTTEASWDSFETDDDELNKDNSKSASSKKSSKLVFNDENGENHEGGALFSRASNMQSIWKRPGGPIDNGAAAFPLLKSLKAVLHEAGLEALFSFPVVHCPNAFGVALKATERQNSFGKLIPGWKLVYSGDTRPCPELVEASRGATVLIHEATFEDGMVDEAIARNHSTTTEAIETGTSAGVYCILLTHFSQRYPKIPRVDDTHMHKTCIGFDMMSVNVADLAVLPKVVPHLKLLFKNEMEVDEVDEEFDDILGAVVSS